MKAGVYLHLPTAELLYFEKDNGIAEYSDTLRAFDIISNFKFDLEKGILYIFIDSKDVLYLGEL